MAASLSQDDLKALGLTSMKARKFVYKISSSYGDYNRNQICHDKITFRLKNDPINKFVNLGNRLINRVQLEFVD